MFELEFLLGEYCFSLCLSRKIYYYQDIKANSAFLFVCGEWERHLSAFGENSPIMISPAAMTA